MAKWLAATEVVSGGQETTDKDKKGGCDGESDEKLKRTYLDFRFPFFSSRICICDFRYVITIDTDSESWYVVHHIAMLMCRAYDTDI